MKILFFADKLPPEIGGMETHAHYFIQYFSSKENLVIFSSKNGVDVIVDDSYKVVQHIQLLTYLKLFATEKCIVFFNSGFWIEQFEAIKLMLPKSIFVYRTGGNEINKAALSQNIAKHSERQQYWVNTINKCIDFLIANSLFTEKRLLDLGLQNHIVKVIAGGIDVDALERAISKKSETRELLGCDDSDKLIVCCCRFVPYKRTDFLLRAFQYLPKQYKVFLVGDGSLFDRANMMAKEMNLRVSFLGRLAHDETLNIIATSNVYCQSSTDLLVNVTGGKYIHTEGMGRSLIESICVGTRVVVSSCGAVSEFINKDNGVVTDGAEHEFALQIENALSLPRIEEKIRVHYCNQYSFERIFRGYELLWK